MKRVLSLLILIACFAATSWAESEADARDDAGNSVQLRADIEIDVDSAASPFDRGQFSRSVRTTVLEAILAALEDDSDFSDAQRQAATQALRDRSQSDDWTDLDSAASPYAGLNIIDRADGWWIAAVSIVSIVLIFGTPIMLVAAVLYAGHRKRRLASDMASRFLASGQEVPPEVWRGLSGDASPRSNLHKGMTMLGVGLGIFLCFWLIGSIKTAYLGLIPMFIGIAQLLIWKLEKQKASPEE